MITCEMEKGSSYIFLLRIAEIYFLRNFPWGKENHFIFTIIFLLVNVVFFIWVTLCSLKVTLHAFLPAICIVFTLNAYDMCKWEKSCSFDIFPVIINFPRHAVLLFSYTNSAAIQSHCWLFRFWFVVLDSMMMIYYSVCISQLLIDTLLHFMFDQQNEFRYSE